MKINILQGVKQVLAETIDSNTPIKKFSKYEIKSVKNSLISLARTPEIGQGLGRILSCGARKPEQT